jgi:hypothetical protein
MIHAPASKLSKMSLSMFTSLLREAMRRLRAAVPAHVRKVRLRGLVAPALASIRSLRLVNML